MRVTMSCDHGACSTFRSFFAGALVMVLGSVAGGTVEIRTVEDLRSVADDLTATYELTCDIDLADVYLVGTDPGGDDGFRL